jgi:hypothetical protein
MTSTIAERPVLYMFSISLVFGIFGISAPLRTSGRTDSEGSGKSAGLIRFTVIESKLSCALSGKLNKSSSMQYFKRLMELPRRVTV